MTGLAASRAGRARTAVVVSSASSIGAAPLRERGPEHEVGDGEESVHRLVPEDAGRTPANLPLVDQIFTHFERHDEDLAWSYRTAS